MSEPKPCSLITHLRHGLSNHDFKSEGHLKAGSCAVVMFSMQLLRFWGVCAYVCGRVCFDVNRKY